MGRQPDAPLWLGEIPAVEILRLVWLQQFWIEEGKLSFRSNDNIPPSSLPHMTRKPI
jgi:transposase